MGSASAKADTSLRLGQQITCKFSVLNLPPPSLTPARPKTMVRPTSGGCRATLRVHACGLIAMANDGSHKRPGSDPPISRKTSNSPKGSSASDKRLDQVRDAAPQRKGPRRNKPVVRTVAHGQGLPALVGIHGRHHRGRRAWLGASTRSRHQALGHDHPDDAGLRRRHLERDEGVRLRPAAYGLTVRLRRRVPPCMSRS